jgi:hypothetical protein
VKKQPIILIWLLGKKICSGPPRLSRLSRPRLLSRLLTSLLWYYRNTISTVEKKGDDTIIVKSSVSFLLTAKMMTAQAETEESRRSCVGSHDWLLSNGFMNATWNAAGFYSSHADPTTQDFVFGWWSGWLSRRYLFCCWSALIVNWIHREFQLRPHCPIKKRGQPGEIMK